MVSSQGINMSSSVSSPKKYDVYLNFRSEDVGNTFVSHLYEALCRNKIETYVDLDDYLERTENFSVGTMKAIDESKLSVIIFSENYASSAKCLDQLLHILECKERMRQLVIPVYYHVDPSHIRKPHGSCEASFKNELDKVDRWRRALEAASDLSGWNSSTIKPESKLVETIVEDIVQKLNHISSDNDSECLVGIDARTKKIESLLCIGSPDVRIVGIWGLGGIGKTTLASVVYNRLASQFESCHFLANVKEEARRHGLINLGNKLLAELLEEENQHFGPSTCSKEKLRRRKVLVVLDDVNNSNQFELLARDHDRFGYGSRIIVTTRDRQVLKNIGANEIYRVEELNYHEALQLFCSTAFRKGDFPTTDYMELSTEIVNYARGIPLPLKVLGSHFQFNRSREYWENELTKLRNVPNTVVEDLLKIVFDALDDTQKVVFLDIACFLRDEKRDFVERVLDYQDFSINEALNDLRDRCLLTFDSSNKVQMHDLVVEMGHEIVRRESIMEPEKQNRLWNSEDVRYVFEHGLGTAAVEGLFLDLSEIDSKIHLKSTVFKDMANLKLLKIYFSNTKKLKVNILPRGLDALPDSLRYLHWDNYPVNSLPSNFLPGNLVELNMPCSKIEKLWDGHQDLGKLKKINLSYSVHLTQIPDLSRAPNLERIYLECCESLNEVPTHFRHLKELTILSLNGCSSLDKFPELPRSVKYLNMSKTNIKIVPSSIECLSSLTMLLLSDCKRLESLPTSFCKLKSLHCLNVSGCSKLLKLPEILEPMEDLRFLYLNNTAIRELPSSIENLIHLEALHLQMCESLKLFPSNIYKLNHLENLIASNCMELEALPPMSVGFQSLTRLNLSNCSMLDITDQLGFLSSLESLDLSGSIIDRVPKSIIKLSKLKYLDISNCRKLLALPEIPLFVEFVDAHGCTSLETVSSSKFALTKGWDRFPVSSEKLVFFNCLKLDQNARSNLITDARLRILRMAFISSLKSVPEYSSVSICYPGNQIPKWFNYRSMGSSIHVKLSPHWRNSNFLGFSLCVVAAPFSEHNDHPQIHFHCESSFRAKNGKAHTFKCFLRGYSQDDDEDTAIIFRNSDHLFLWYDYGSYLHEMEDTFTEASFNFYPIDSWERKVNSCQVEKCGIHLLYLQEAARFGFINQGLLGESKVEPFAFSGESEVEASDSGTNDSNDGIKELEVEEDSIQNESEPSSGGNVDSGIKEEGDDDNQQPKENYKRKSNSCGCLPFLSLIKEFWEHVLGKQSGYDRGTQGDEGLRPQSSMSSSRSTLSRATAVPVEVHLQAQEERIQSMNSQIMELQKQNKWMLEHLKKIK
ncbi:TIR-NBS-LRR-like protein [Trema orientale]|uniref:ADP-ribosyl cyclase/cyclic ADP-ribose hydrolase n=1 Tax=Trema orientale TaxID=63057 RepID=A0A2P5FRC4_TREOI|nr:TIR-NBS-LRR-like protein [Trema orientale]